MDKRLGTLLLSWGVFHVFSYAQPLPSPHKQRWTRVSRIFSECQLCLGWREGELKENVGKDALFYEVTQKLQKIMNTAFLSPRTFVHDCSCGDRYKVFSFFFFRYWWPTSLAAFTAWRYQIPRLLMFSRNLSAGTSSVTRKNSFQRFKKDSSHNQAVASIEATTHSHDSEIWKLNF